MFTVTTEHPGQRIGEGSRCHTECTTGLSIHQAALILGNLFPIPDGEAWRRLSGRLVALPPGCRFAGPGRDGQWVSVEREYPRHD